MLKHFKFINSHDCIYAVNIVFVKSLMFYRSVYIQ
jgi:hypothetical protein